MTKATFSPLLSVVMLLLLNGCQESMQRGDLLQQARADYDRQQFSSARQSATRYLGQPALPDGDRCRGYYIRGLALREMGPAYFTQAKTDLQTVLARQCNPELAALAHVTLGHIAFESSDHDTARMHYEFALKNLPNTEPKDAVLYRLGVSLQRLGRWSQADPYFEQCAREFSQSPYASSARQHLGSRRFQLQAGAWSTTAGALKQQKKLQRSGFSADMTPLLQNGKSLYAVRCGAFTSYEQAQSQLQRLQRTVPDAIIIAAD